MDAEGRMLAVGEALEEWRCELVAGYLYPPLLTFSGYLQDLKVRPAGLTFKSWRYPENVSSGGYK